MSEQQQLQQSQSIDTQELIEFGQDSRKFHDHIVDSTNLLIFTILLILVVLTIWLFKHKRFPYVHETGLAIIYGAVVGIIIRYALSGTNKKTINFYPNSINISDLPEYVYLTVNNNQSQQTFVYEYKNPKRFNDRYGQEYEEKARFDPEIFFNILLPPIIFNAGYSMKKVKYFKIFQKKSIFFNKKLNFMFLFIKETFFQKLWCNIGVCPNRNGHIGLRNRV